MNIQNRFNACWKLAGEIVRSYRNAAPKDFDPQNTFGIVATAGTALLGGVGSFLSGQSKQDALDYQASHTPTLQSYTPTFAQYDPSAGLSQYFGAYGTFGQQAQDTANQQNDYYLQSIKALAPGLPSGLQRSSLNANQNLRGQLPRDLAQQISRGAAQAGLVNGFGADSGMGHNLTARDLGTNSLSLQSTGMQQLAGEEAIAKSLRPYDAFSILGTPAQYAGRNDQYQFENTGIDNTAKQDAASVLDQNAIFQYQSGLAGAQADSINPGLLGGLGAAGGLVQGLGQYGGRLSHYFGFGSPSPAQGGFPSYSPQYGSGIGFVG